MLVGIPREILQGERRVALTPETTKRLVDMGVEVVVETSAGAGIMASDEMYRQAGASIAPDARAVWETADLVLKVKQPCPNEVTGEHEADLIKMGASLVTFLHPAAPGSHDMVRRLAARNVTAFTMDAIPRTSRAQRMDALTSMSTVTGYRATLIAAEALPRFVPLVGTAVGMVKPAKALVVGAGVVGLQALATLKRLGAVSTCVDIRPPARESATSLGAKDGGFEMPAELATGPGGYARALPPEWLAREIDALTPLVADADMIILSALVPGEVAPILITEAMINQMRPGSVIVDVAIDQGGNCALTQPGETIEVGGVTLVGTQNIPGSMPEHSTWLYANNMLAYLENLYKGGPGVIDFDDDIVRTSLVTRDGNIVHSGTRKAMGLPRLDRS
jgi:NAD(P) transhydrogenase subunit alpha